MDDLQMKVNWQGEVVSVQPRSTVWRYLIDNRTHRECGYNVFLKGEAYADSELLHHDSGSDKYDFCVAISEKQEEKLKIHIGDVLKGTGWTKKYLHDVYTVLSFEGIGGGGSQDHEEGGGFHSVCVYHVL